MNNLLKFKILLLISLWVVTVKAQKPNIIFILTDDLGYGDVSCQGGTDIQTPHIDQLAQSGLTFRNFYANSTVCSPSRAALMTGKYPDYVGVPGVIRQKEKNNWGYFKEGVPTMAELLKKASYHTALVGKWHLGLEPPNTPSGRGFDYFKGFLGDMMSDYWTHLRHGINWMRFNDQVIDPKGHATDIFTDWAIQYITAHKDDKNPFFLYLAYNAPHFPMQPPKDFLEKVKKREKGITEKRAKAVALVEHLDFSIGKLMNHLKETGLLDHTLVVFSSDNGGSLRHGQSNGKLRGGKKELFEGGIRVPTFAVWKGKIKPGMVTENVGLLMDWFSTLGELAGIEDIPENDGISLLPTLLGKEQVTDDRYLFWVRKEGGPYGGQSHYAARYKGYKILQNSAYEPFSFFNIMEDEYEEKELDPGNSEEYNKLRAELTEHVRKAGAIPWQPIK